VKPTVQTLIQPTKTYLNQNNFIFFLENVTFCQNSCIFVQQRNKNSMQKFTRKYQKFMKELRVAQVTFDSNPTPKNLKSLSLLKAIKWSDSERYSANYLRANKPSIKSARVTYSQVPSFFSVNLI